MAAIGEGKLKRRMFLGVLGAAIMTPGSAFAVTPKASEAVAQAAAGAEANGKRLLLVFHASWCGYCQLLDMMLEDAVCAPILDRHFVIYHLRALERKPEMKAQQLDGADDVYSSLVADRIGLPYMAALDGKAVRVADSVMRNGDNFGFPVDAVELDNFQDMMRTAAPKMTIDEARTLRRTCIKIYRQN